MCDVSELLVTLIHINCFSLIIYSLELCWYINIIFETINNSEYNALNTHLYLSDFALKRQLIT